MELELLKYLSVVEAKDLQLWVSFLGGGGVVRKNSHTKNRLHYIRVRNEMNLSFLIFLHPRHPRHPRRIMDMHLPTCRSRVSISP